MKPLGVKAYGSIPHLPNSRLGPKDYSCGEGEAKICFEGGRTRGGKIRRVIVTEKLDGSNVAIANVGGQVVALNRAGYMAQKSPRRQHQIFAEWVRRREKDFTHLPDGWRISGEWLYIAHGTIYEGHAPFIAFDVFDASNSRIPHDEARKIMADVGVRGAHVIHDGEAGMTAEAAMDALGLLGFHGAKERVEGAVWRVETGGRFSFLAKFVRHGKVDGKYLGDSEVLMCDPLGSGAEAVK